MSSTAQLPSSPPVSAKPPQAVLGEMINGYWVTQTVTAVAMLGIADLLASGPTDVATLATLTATNQAALYRLLRAAASIGVFTEDESGRFVNTELSSALQSDIPGSMHGLAVMTGMLHMHAWPEILHSVRTGKTAFEKVFGVEIFDHLARDRDAAAAFDAAMAGYTGVTSAAMAAAYDFSKAGLIVDVGGGNGALLRAILPTAPSARGLSFDRPHATARASATMRAASLDNRCTVESGDFFERVPAGGDIYTMKMILHDWDDDRAVAILRRVRDAIVPNGRVLVMESVIPGGNTPSPGKLLDVNMLVMTGGRERTREEFQALFTAAGFELIRVIDAHPTMSIVEGQP